MYSSTLSLTSVLDGLSGCHTPNTLLQGMTQLPTLVRGWVGPKPGFDRCGKLAPHRDSISGPSDHRESLYRLNYSVPSLGVGSSATISFSRKTLFNKVSLLFSLSFRSERKSCLAIHEGRYESNIELHLHKTASRKAHNLVNVFPKEAKIFFMIR